MTESGCKFSFNTVLMSRWYNIAAYQLLNSKYTAGGIRTDRQTLGALSNWTLTKANHVIYDDSTETNWPQLHCHFASVTQYLTSVDEASSLYCYIVIRWRKQHVNCVICLPVSRDNVTHKILNNLDVYQKCVLETKHLIYVRSFTTKAKNLCALSGKA